MRITVYRSDEAAPTARFFACIHVQNERTVEGERQVYWERMPVSFFAASEEDVRAKAQANWDEGVAAMAAKAKAKAARKKPKATANEPEIDDEPPEVI